MKRSTTMFALLCGFSLVVLCESFAAAGPKVASHPGKPQAHSPAPAAKKAPVQVKGGKLPANNGAAKSNPTKAQTPAKQANKGASQKPHMENQTTDDDGWDASSDGTPDVGDQGTGGSGGSNTPPQNSQPSGNSRQRTIFGGPPRTSVGQVK